MQTVCVVLDNMMVVLLLETGRKFVLRRLYVHVVLAFWHCLFLFNVHDVRLTRHFDHDFVYR